MNQLTQTDAPQDRSMLAGMANSGFDRMLMEGTSNMNSGAVAIESQRAIAEARGQMQLARMFPRSVNEAMSEFLESCKSPEFAAEAFYTVKNRGSGPSIRFAEEAARCYGHFDYGHRELSRGDGKSEIEVFAWDKQKNNVSKRQITVLHVLDSGTGSRKLTQQTDIDNKIANVASKQMRGRILALLPKHMIAAGKAECQRTLAGGNDKPIAERITACTQRFDRRGVTREQIANYLNIAKVDDMTAEMLSDMQGVFNAIKEGAKVEDYFGGDTEQDIEGGEQDTGAAITSLQQRAANNGAPASSKGTTGKPQDGEKTSATAKTTTKAKAAAPAPAPAPEPERRTDPLDNLKAETAHNPDPDETGGANDSQDDDAF